MPFIGRRAEDDLLADALLRATAREPTMVVIDGEAGVGKSRLVERFADRAENAGSLVLTGRCIDLGQDGIPLGAMIGALEGLVRRIGGDALFGLFPGAAELACLLPEFAGAEPPPPGRLYSLLACLLERLSAEQPVCLIVEDVHWADRSTRRLLDVLARSLRDCAVLIVVTCRTDGLGKGHPVGAFLAELDRLSSVHRVTLERFGRDETAELVTLLFGEAPSTALVDRIHGRSGGNAFFVQELARAELAGVPDELGASLRGLLLDRVERLSEPAKQLIRLSAVGGARFEHRLLVAASGAHEQAVITLLREAVDAHVLIARDGGYAFRHALVREAVYGDLLPAERRCMHRQYAAALESLPDLVSAAELAHHWYIADDPAKALLALVHAAGTAARLHAYDEQLFLLTRALGVYPRVPDSELDHVLLLESAVGAAHRAGEYGQAIVLADRALAAIDAELEPERVAVLLAHRARSLHFNGGAGVLAAAEEAERLTAGSTSAARVAVLDVYTIALMREDHAEDPIPLAREAARIADELGDIGLRISSKAALGVALGMSQRHEQALTELETAQKLATEHGHLAGLARIQMNLAYLHWEVGSYRQSIAAAEGCRDSATSAGLFRRYGGHAVSFMAASMFALGRWDDAEAQLGEQVREAAPDLFAIFPHIVYGELAAARGRFEAAHEHLSAARDLTARFGVTQGVLLIGRLAAEIALLEGRVADAREAISEAITSPWPMDSVTEMWSLVTTGARVESHSRARARLSPGVPQDEDLLQALRAAAAGLPDSTPSWRAQSLQCAAELDSFDTSSAGWSEVAIAWDQAHMPWQAAQARVRAAEAVAARGDRAAAQSLLRAAAGLADELGARPLRREVDLLAQRLGVNVAKQPAAREPQHPLNLTPKETEVLRLITGGYSNRKVGAELFITEKTASVHVTRILRKLGLASRGEAAALAHKLRLFEPSQATDSAAPPRS